MSSTGRCGYGPPCRPRTKSNKRALLATPVAKRDKSPEWKPPEFDEVEFMHKEMRAAKATILVVLWTVPSALLSFGLTVAGAPIVAFFAGIGMMFLLKWIFPILKVDISAYKRKDWLGHGATFFFSWLAFWILLLNPPFADLTSPMILGVSATGSGGWVGCGGGPLTGIAGRNVTVNVSASDNVAVAQVTVAAGSTSTNLNHVAGTLWQGPVAFPGAGQMTVTVRDVNGHASSCVVSYR